LRLVDAGHQHPAGGVAPKLDFADGQIEPAGGIISGRADRPGGAGQERVGGQISHAGRCHHRENVTPVESASVHVSLPHSHSVAATIADLRQGRTGARPFDRQPYTLIRPLVP
jgi:hypothetical protein